MTGRDSPVEIVTMHNGVRALQDNTVREVMHPVVGPLVEAEQLYAGPARLAERLAENTTSALTVLDVGLGAGSNAAAAWRAAQQPRAGGRALALLSFERDLEAFRLAARPENAPDFGLDGPVAQAALDLLTHGQHAGFGNSWRLVLGELPNTLSTLPDGCADIVFWDPFSPKANPNMWNMHAFEALRRVCRLGATVHTYSGATAVRSALLLAGFVVGFGRPSGSRGQTTMAATALADVPTPLDSRWLERLRRSSVPFPADAPHDALERVAQSPQFRAESGARSAGPQV